MYERGGGNSRLGLSVVPPDRDVPFLDSSNPLDELASGAYERLIQLALGLTYGVVT